MSISPKDVVFKDIHEGDRVSFERHIGEEELAAFAALSGDENPLHMDADYAEAAGFGGRIVHGMLLGGLFSGIVGMLLPGKRALYLSQDLRFHNPLKVRSTAIVSGEVVKKYDALHIIELKTVIKDEEGKTIVDGAAKVKVRER